MDSPWRIDLFGGVTLRLGERVLERFQTAKTGSLLAFLAWQRRPVNREALIDLLWPDADLDAARNRLRVALNSLRRQLEPPGVPGGAVLVADRNQVSLNPAAFRTDVAEFEAVLERERLAASDAERIACLREAVRLYRGELLAGLYDEWLLPERTRLADACLGALKRLSRLLAQAHEYEAALDCARRAVAMDPLGESLHRTLMRLYARTGRPAAAARQYAELTTLLQDELGTRPSAATRKLARKVARTGRGTRASSPAPDKRPGDRGPETLGSRRRERAHDAADAAPGRPSEPRRDRKRAGKTDTAESAAPPEVIPVAPRPDTADGGGGIPLQFTRFFGREPEMARLLDLLDPAAAPALVTLTGPGGIGKTRLAAQAASHLRERYAGRVWFVSLGDLAGGKEPVAVLAAGLGVHLSAGAALPERVLQKLSQAPALLVFDDLDDATRLAGLVEWLRVGVPRLALLVTSRRRQDLEGEREVVVSTLPVPPLERSPRELVACPSVALFVDRAQAARPDFQVTPGNAATVAELCGRLEGIPLALELAAAWAQVLTPSQMLERLGNRFDLLVSRRKARAERHRSLRAAIESTHDMLPDDLRAFFHQVSIFRGGWTLEAAEQVLAQPAALDLLDGLRAFALVRADESGAQMRFHLLDSLREFAAEQLDEPSRQRLEQTHARFYLDVVVDARARLVGPEAEAWLERLDHDHDNLHAALSWWLAHGEGQDGLRMAAVMGRFWHARGHVAEGARWLRRALQETAPDAGAADRACALEALGRLAASLGDRLEACECFTAALALARAEPDLLRATLVDLCLVASELNDQEAAHRACAERVAHGRMSGDPWMLARALSDLGRVALARGQRQEAVRALQETLALRRSLGDRWGAADALISLAGADEERASRHQAEGQAIFEALEDIYGVGATCLNVGSLASEQGDLPLARDLLLEALETFQALQDQWYVALCLEQLGQVARRQEDAVAARAWLTESLTLRRVLQDSDGASRLSTLAAAR